METGPYGESIATRDELIEKHGPEAEVTYSQFYSDFERSILLTARLYAQLAMLLNSALRYRGVSYNQGSSGIVNRIPTSGSSTSRFPTTTLTLTKVVSPSSGPTIIG